jgi:hypothetical protein
VKIIVISPLILIAKSYQPIEGRDPFKPNFSITLNRKFLSISSEALVRTMLHKKYDSFFH